MMLQLERAKMQINIIIKFKRENFHFPLRYKYAYPGPLLRTSLGTLIASATVVQKAC